MSKPKSLRSTHKELIEITPALAREFLSKLYDKQRPVRKSAVTSYAFQMRNGSWHQEQPDCVLHFNEDGSVLYDGQHRMLAIVESDTTQRMWVEYGATEEDYRYMDAGVKRSVSDQLGRPNSGPLAALAKMAAATVTGEKPMASCLEGWVSGKAQIPRDMIIAYVDDNEDLLHDCISYGNRISHAWANDKFRSTLHYASWFIMWCFEGDCFPDFVDDFCADGATTTNAVAMLHQYISRLAASSTTSSLDKPGLIAAICCAYESYCGKDDKKRIQTSMINKYRNICDQKIAAKRSAQNAARASYIKQQASPKPKVQKQSRMATKDKSVSDTKPKLSVKYPQVGSRVYHISFGYGKVIRIESDRLHIQFNRDRNPRTLMPDGVDKGILEVI